jgi:hypothetical protein
MVDSVRMLSLDDNRWNNLTGGYRMKCTPDHYLYNKRVSKPERRLGMDFGKSFTIRRG